MIYIPIWWLILQLLSLIALPIGYTALRWLPDRGYAFSKALGLLLVSYIVWLGAMTGLLTNTVGGIIIAILIVAGISGGLLWFNQRRGHSISEMWEFLKSHKATILTVEILFLLAFLAWVTVRAFATSKIMTSGGEKYMEIAFLNGILNSPRFPPLDPWLSGFSISYYYFGYIMMAIMTRLSGAPSGIGFELYDALLFALTMVGAYGVVYNLVPASKRPHQPIDSYNHWQPVSYGLLGALFTAVMGNLEGLFEGLHSANWLPQSFFEWLNINGLAEAPVNGSFYPGGSGGWWWWRGSRVLLDRNLNFESFNDSNITEFPFFSFLLGDNHPHVLNLPFVLLALALGLNLLRMTLHHQPDEKPSLPWWNPLAAFDGNWALFLFYGLCLGALGFLNTWDYPIYLGVTALAYGVGLYTFTRRINGELVGRVFALGVGLLLSGVLFYILFYVTFSSQAGGILPFILPPSRLPHYLVMFGPFIYILIGFLLIALQRSTHQFSGVWKKTLLWWLGLILSLAGIFLVLAVALPAIDAVRQAVQGAMANPGVAYAFGDMTLQEAIPVIIKARLLDPWVFLLLTGMITFAVANVYWRAQRTEKVILNVQSHSAGLLFACILIFTGLALTLSVEFVYLRDVFGNRMNTVFKFYYQAWVLFAIASAYGLWWINNRGVVVTGKAFKYVFEIITTILILAAMIYPSMAVLSRTNSFSGVPYPPNLDGSSNTARENPDDWSAIEWLRAYAGHSIKGNPYDVPVILEAPGGSYDYKGRISAFTGLPAVLGWAGHELQWRGNYDEQALREPDIQTIYTTHDPQLALELLQKWKVDYVIVGPTENQYIQKACTSGGVRCNPDTAVQKFDTILAPVFQSGGVTIYRVP